MTSLRVIGKDVAVDGLDGVQKVHSLTRRLDDADSYQLVTAVRVGRDRGYNLFVGARSDLRPAPVVRISTQKIYDPYDEITYLDNMGVHTLGVRANANRFMPHGGSNQYMTTGEERVILEALVTPDRLEPRIDGGTQIYRMKEIDGGVTMNTVDDLIDALKFSGLVNVERSGSASTRSYISADSAVGEVFGSRVQLERQAQDVFDGISAQTGLRFERPEYAGGYFESADPQRVSVARFSAKIATPVYRSPGIVAKNSPAELIVSYRVLQAGRSA